VKLHIPYLNKNLHLPTPKTQLIDSILAPFLPFSNEFSCFAGEYWFCANRLAAEYIIDFHKTKTALADHYRMLDECTIVPDESYFQTILCNSPNLRISKNNWRYIDWLGNGGPVPKLLSIEDLPKLRESMAHFARKFDADMDGDILDALDTVT
jgi:hypothetical protein